MNKISHRTYFALILACVLLLGLVGFTARYFVEADQWAGHSGNFHIYDNSGELDVDLKITDRSGTELYSTQDGKTYAADSDTRKAVLHLTGDRDGNIPSTLLDEYGGSLIGYNKLTGLYGAVAQEGVETLTVSAQVQRAALSAMNGYSGTVGVYNYKTGEILCAISTPTFDPDNVPDIADNPAYNGVYVNRLFHASYTPGSIFKLVTTTAAIEQMDDWDTRTWVCNGTYDIGDDTVVCHGTHGTVTLEEALAHSCNVAFAQIAVELGEDTLKEYVSKLGIQGKLSFDGYTTRAGSFTLDDSPDFDVAWAGIGQHDDLINPCQYMTLMGAIANGGQAASPYLVSQVTSDDKTTYRAGTTMLDTVMSEDTAAALRDLMRNNVRTMYGAITLDLPVCAKSGTAEVSADGSVTNATFAGFIDDEDYPLAFIVVVEGGASGSQVAAPIANTVLWKCIEVLDAE